MIYDKIYQFIVLWNISVTAHDITSVGVNALHGYPLEYSDYFLVKICNVMR